MIRSFLFPKSICFSACLASALMTNLSATAQQDENQTKAADVDAQQEWYYGGNKVEVPTKSIAQQKSEKRAEQRMARLEAMRWYGFSGTRPTAAALPFTTKYSPSWTRPGGRPFAWYTGGAPSVVIQRPHRFHRYW